MQICPVCEARYDDDQPRCDRDGAMLIPESHSPSIDVAFSAADYELPADATRAESPSGRQRFEHSSSSTKNESGTRVSRGEPPQESSDTSEPPSKRDEAKQQAEARCGEVLGSYRLQSVLGFGGMGAVYTAEHLKLGRKVALKLLHRQYASRREAVVRFFQEAQAVNRIRHKNIVDVTDLVELDDGTAFIIMELLEGESLGGRLRRVGLLGTGPTISVLIQICDALSAAHSVDIVHRDLKPDNIFLTTSDDGELLVKLLDFGVAKLVGKDPNVGVKTAVGSVVGTPAFMSPEQSGALEVDRRSDIYSLGAIMYQLLTGQHVFRGKSFGEYVKMHLNDEPTPARQTPGGSSMDLELEAIIMRCLKKSPNARFQTAAELRVALVSYFETYAGRVGGSVEGGSGIYRLSGIRSSSVPPSPFAPPPSTIDASMTRGPGFGPETAMEIGNLPPQRRGQRRPVILFAAGATALLAIVLIVSLALSGDDKSASAPVAIDAAASAPVVAVLLPDAAVAPEAIRFRVESNVLARVFLGDSDQPHCGTPCTIVIDPTDGGGDRRALTVRAKGHGDGFIEVDLNDTQETYSIELESLASTEADAGATKVTKTSNPKDRGGRDNKTDSNKTDSNKTDSNKTDKGKAGKGKGKGTTPTDAVPADQTLDPFGRNKRQR